MSNMKSLRFTQEGLLDSNSPFRFASKKTFTSATKWANEDSMIEYLTEYDLYSNRKIASSFDFEKIVKKLIALKADIEASEKSLNEFARKLEQEEAVDLT